MADIFDVHFPDATLTIPEDGVDQPIVLDDVTLKALVARAISDAGDLVTGLATQSGEVPAPATSAFGEITWDVAEELIPVPVQAEILRLVSVGLALWIREVLTQPDIHPFETPAT